MPSAREVMISALAQPAWPARTSPQTRQTTPTETNATPGGYSDRHVDPEDPVPVEPFGDRAADQRADRDSKAREPAVDADNRAAPLGGKRRRQDGQAKRKDSGAAEALHGAGCDQQGRGGREGAGG